MIFKSFQRAFWRGAIREGRERGRGGRAYKVLSKKKLIYLQKLMKNHSVSHNFSAQYELLKLTMIKTEMKAGF